MSKKKIVTLLLVVFGLFFVGIQISSKVGLNNTVEAAKKSKLIPYYIPKRFRGTWHSSTGDYVRFTSRRVSFSKHSRGSLTYSFNSKNVPNGARIFLIQPHGKEIIVCAPYCDGTGFYRQGKYLIGEGMGQKWRYHR